MATLYVSKTAKFAFKSIGAAVQKAKAGDTIVVKAGLYKENVFLGKDGLTLKAEKPGTVKIDASGNPKKMGVQIAADYVTVEGLEVFDSGQSGIGGVGVHHARVINNVSHDNARGGVYFGKSDLLEIDGNVTYGNAATGPFSGISVHIPVRQGGKANLEGEFRIVVRDNVSYDNVQKNKGAHTDGNGIIFDDWRTTQHKDLPTYTGRGLVEGNIVHHNGGEGIQIAWTDNAVVRGNIAYHNGQDRKAETTWRGEISNMESSGTLIEDNVAVADKEKYGWLKHNTGISNVSRKSYDNEDVRFEDNFTFNGVAGEAAVRANNDNDAPSAGSNHLGVNPGLSFDGENLELAPWSPLIGTGIGDDFFW